MQNDHALLVFTIMMAITFLLRSLPFVAASWLKQHPLIQHLGKHLPLAILVLLLINSAWGEMHEDHDRWWPVMCSITMTILIQCKFRHPLLSILVGTVSYLFWRNSTLTQGM